MGVLVLSLEEQRCRLQRLTKDPRLDSTPVDDLRDLTPVVEIALKAKLYQQNLTMYQVEAKLLEGFVETGVEAADSRSFCFSALSIAVTCLAAYLTEAKGEVFWLAACMASLVISASEFRSWRRKKRSAAAKLQEMTRRTG